jgi:hypothetical protein
LRKEACSEQATEDAKLDKKDSEGFCSLSKLVQLPLVESAKDQKRHLAKEQSDWPRMRECPSQKYYYRAWRIDTADDT